MTIARLLSMGLMTAATLTATLPAVAAPEIASGERLLSTDISGCLSEVDTFLEALDIETAEFEIGRTGYFDDGTFRVLCYPNPYEDNDTSLAVIFAAHETDSEVVNTFIEIALERIGSTANSL